MHRNSNEPGINFYETTNAQSVQINTKTGERRSQIQYRNKLSFVRNSKRNLNK